MNYTWNLDVLYKGYEDEKYVNDFNTLSKLITSCKEYAYNIVNITLDTQSLIEGYLSLQEKISYYASSLFSYSSLRSSTNVFDNKASNEIAKLRILFQDTIETDVAFKNFIKDINISEFVNKSSMIKSYEFLLYNLHKSASHLLSPKEEVLASKLNLVGSSSWSDLQQLLTSTLSIKVKGVRGSKPLSYVRGLAYDNDPVIRKNAYLSEIKAMDGVQDSIAMALNNIKREVNIMDELRGYSSALEKTLEQSHMSKATLDAMIGAIKDELPNFRKYFIYKAKALGYQNGLPFYDLFAPMGKLTKTYTIEEAKDLVLDVYKSFSESLYNLGRDAFNNRWIDFLPNKGKVGGAFCAGVDNIGQSRVLTNFTGSLGDVQTLAHELGHAYHGRVCLDNDILNRDYPMQLAETASILCQTLMAKKMIEDTIDPLEKLTIVEQSLQEDTQCIVDILSRFIFEDKVLNCSIEESINAKMMCEFMLDAQDATYGEGLDKEYRHPYMWLVKGHYYSADLNYYNFPYAFGLLYGKGLYKQYLKDKDSFVKKYDEMLRATALYSIEDVAKIMDIDITKKEFWIESLKFIEEDIDLFYQLLKESKLID